MSKQVIEQTNETSKLTLNINPNISITEQREFIEAVMFDISLSEDNILAFNTEVAFYSNLLKMFTDFETPFEDIDDVVLQMALKEAIYSSSFAIDLKRCIDKQVSLLIQKNEAIETVAYLANRTLDGVNKVCNILDDISDLTKDGKFLKVIPEKKVDFIFQWIQRIVNDFTKVLKVNNNNVVEFKKVESNKEEPK